MFHKITENVLLLVSKVYRFVNNSSSQCSQGGLRFLTHSHLFEVCFLVCPDSAENVAGNGIEDADVGERRFKACNLCGILVDADSPAAMESHLRAHKKNDDLKLKLLARYGPEVVTSNFLLADV